MKGVEYLEDDKTELQGERGRGKGVLGSRQGAGRCDKAAVRITAVRKLQV